MSTAFEVFVQWLRSKIVVPSPFLPVADHLLRPQHPVYTLHAHAHMFRLCSSLSNLIPPRVLRGPMDDLFSLPQLPTISLMGKTSTPHTHQMPMICPLRDIGTLFGGTFAPDVHLGATCCVEVDFSRYKFANTYPKVVRYLRQFRADIDRSREPRVIGNLVAQSVRMCGEGWSAQDRNVVMCVVCWAFNMSMSLIKDVGMKRCLLPSFAICQFTTDYYGMEPLYKSFEAFCVLRCMMLDTCSAKHFVKYQVGNTSVSADECQYYYHLQGVISGYVHDRNWTFEVEVHVKNNYEQLQDAALSMVREMQ